jgi:hypothetical protein
MILFLVHLVLAWWLSAVRGVISMMREMKTDRSFSHRKSSSTIDVRGVPEYTASEEVVEEALWEVLKKVVEKVVEQSPEEGDVKVTKVDPLDNRPRT